jgi:hypothetical protein
VMLLTSLIIRRKSWKGFHKKASRNVFNTSTLLAEVHICTRGLFWRNVA